MLILRYILPLVSVFFLSCEKDDKVTIEVAKKTKLLNICQYDDCRSCNSLEIYKGVFLTAGHCFEKKFNKVSVLKNGSYSEVEILKTLFHPNYDPSTYKSDIAILVGKNFDLSNNLGQDTIFLDFEIEKDAVLESYLYDGKRLKNKKQIFDRQLSTQVLTKDFSRDDASCKGNSGGPTYFLEEGVYYLVGILSGSSPITSLDCNDGGYTIFASVFKLGDWIDETLGNL